MTFPVAFLLIIYSGSWLQKGLKQAVVEHARQQGLFKSFEATFPSETIIQWREIYSDWCRNPKKPNPFHLVDRGK
jgi:hypothetical protein